MTEIGDTAIVTFDEFSAIKKDYYAEVELNNPRDTIELVAAAHKQITREDSPIKNVVLDLSCNGGGDADAAAFVIAWFTGGKQVGMRDTLTGAQSVVSYVAAVDHGRHGRRGCLRAPELGEDGARAGRRRVWPCGVRV